MKSDLLQLLAAARATGLYVMNTIAPPRAKNLPKLMQLALANADKPGTVRAEQEDDVAHVYVYGVIGGWFGDVNAQAFATALAGLDAKTVHLHVNSPGGDVFEARAMMAAIRNHGATFIAHVDGLAASAASFLLMACHEIEIVQGGFVMIHNAWTVAMGNKAELRQTADLLEKVDGTIQDDYWKRTKKDKAQLQQWMDAETWFTAEEAKEHGFVDRIIELVPEKDGDTTEARAWNLAAYEKAPAAAAQRVSPAKAAAPAAQDDAPRIAAQRARLERRLGLLERTGA